MRQSYVKGLECFMPKCLNNIYHFCQCKPDNITPGDIGCAKRQLAKEEK